MKTAFAFAAIATLLSGCGISKAVGGGKNAPDEFAITTKAPLVVPPDYALRPPKPGESRPQELSPSERARQVLLGDGTAEPPTVGEQALIQKAGALSSDGNIRAILGAENGGRAEKDRSLANQLLFWKFEGSEIDDSSAPLRVDDIEAWHAERNKAVKQVTGDEGEVKIEKSKTLNLPGIL